MLGGLALSLAGARAEAAEARYRLSIPPKAYIDALIDLGTQANISVIGTSACGSGGQAGVVGILTLEEALNRLLAAAPCSYKVLDPRTVRIGPPVQARREEAAPRAPTLIAEILVTATKRPASTTRLPASVSVISREQIEVTGATDVLQTTGQISGVLSTNLGPGRDKLILRGLSDGAFTGRARSTVCTYLDDTPINYNAPDPDLQLVDLERIEVIRGPQGALYGSGSLSGVFRIVPRKPDMTGFDFGLAAQGAHTEGGSDSGEIEGYGNIPLVRDYAAVRIVGYHDDEGGYIDNKTLRLSNVDRTVREGGRAALRLQPADDWQVDLSVIAQRLRLADTQYTTPGEGRTNRATRVRESHKNDFAVASGTLRGELGWATLRASVAYTEHIFSSQYDASQVVSQVFNDPSDLGVYLERTRINMVSQDTVLRSSRPGPLTWLVGVYAVNSIEKSPSTIDVQARTGLLQRVYTEQRRDRLSEGAVYGEASYAFAPGWSVSVGGRLFNADVHTQSEIVGKPPAVSRSFRNKRHFEGFLPKLSIEREVGSGGMVYALFSEGYRIGGFNSGGFNFPFLIPSRAYFDPDRLRNYELGLKTGLFDHRLSLHTAVFFDRWTKIQTDQYRNVSGLAYTANIGDADITGLEAELAYDFDFGLSVQANTLFASSRVTQTNSDFAPALISGLPSAPRFSGGLVAVYQHPLPRNLTLKLIGETSYVGRSELSFDATKQSEMGQYANTRLSAQLAGRSWKATVFVSNPFNVAGDTFAYGNPFTFGTKRQSTPQRPRTVGLRLAADY